MPKARPEAVASHQGRHSCPLWNPGDWLCCQITAATAPTLLGTCKNICEWKERTWKPTNVSQIQFTRLKMFLNKPVLTVNEVNVMHIPPKPFRAKAIKMSTESAVGRHKGMSRGTQQHRTPAEKATDKLKIRDRPLRVRDTWREFSFLLSSSCLPCGA